MKATEKYGIHCQGEIYVDTTGISDHLISNVINDRIYAKEGYVLYFKDGVFNKKYDDVGKLNKIQILTVDDISSNYIDELKPKFENIKNAYGKFSIENIPHFNSQGNEIPQEIKSYNIRFDSLLLQKDVIKYVNYDLQLPCDFLCSSSFPVIVQNDVESYYNSKEFEIISVSPNPLDATGIITFNIPKAAKISISVSDIKGLTTTTKVIDQFFNSGQNSTELSFKEFSSGLYIIIITDGNETITKPFIIKR